MVLENVLDVFMLKICLGECFEVFLLIHMFETCFDYCCSVFVDKGFRKQMENEKRIETFLKLFTGCMNPSAFPNL